MKNFLKLFLIFSFLFIFLLSNSYSQCGKERWPVKTLTDKDTTKIDFTNVIKSSISKQIKMKKPAKIGKNTKRMKSEMKVYELTAYIIEYKKEDDRDYHVVISDVNNGDNMVVEIIDPECPGVSTTSRYKELKKVRDWFTNEFNPTESFKQTHKKVKITGVGFFDFLHGQTGMARNGRELHPILRIEPVKE